MRAFIEGLNKFLDAAISAMIIGALLFSFWSLYDVFVIYRDAGSTMLSFGTQQREISVSEYQEINSDVVAVLKVHNTGIKYPVLQGNDNSEYLNKDVKGEYRASGSIYIDCNNADDFSDPYTLFYGHRMKASAMFGDVGEFTDKEYFDAHTTGTLETPNGTLKITFFACMNTYASDSKVFDLTFSRDSTEAFFEYIRDASCQYREVSLNEDSRVVGLSTCETASSMGRIVLFGVITDGM